MLPETAALFHELQGETSLSQFVLIGGTALGLHIGHRISEDLDFITLRQKLPRAALKQTEALLMAHGHSIKHVDSADAYDDFANAGMDLRDFSQNWLIDGRVKVTFFTADDHHKRLLNDVGSSNGFRVASLKEVADLKAIVSTSRSKSRDWLDLLVLERDHNFGLREWKDAYDRAGLTPWHFENALKRICSGTPSQDDEGFQTLLSNPPSIQEIAARFRLLQENYERTPEKNTPQRPPAPSPFKERQTGKAQQ